MIIELNTTFALLLVGFSILVSFILFIPILKLVLDHSSHAYSNARISAAQGRRIGKELYRSLIEAPKLADMISMLEGTPYEHAFSEISGSQSPESVDMALKKEARRQKEFLLSSTPRDEHFIYGFLIKSEEASVLKEALVSKYSGLKVSILPFGFFDSKMVENLLEGRDIGELLQRLETTDYYEPLKGAFAEFKRTDNLSLLTSVVDRHLYSQLWRRLSIQTGKDRYAKQLFGMTAEIENIKLVLRGISSGSKVQKDELLAGSYELDESRRKKLADSETVAAVLSSVEGTSYHGLLSEAGPSPDEMATALDRFLVGQASRFALSDPLGSGKALAYMLSLEKEIKNLRIIANSKFSGIPAEDVEKLITY
ncbi:MAG: V-type ATPase subunit [archaeon]